MDKVGPTGLRVGRRLNELRRARGSTLGELEARLTELGRPILLSALSKIEKGQRRVDVDDLVALARALDVSPNSLLLPSATAPTAEVELTSSTTVDSATAWQWATRDQRPVRSRRGIFISYTNSNLAWAAWIAWQLAKVGHDVMIDLWDLRPGADIRTYFVECINRAAGVVAVVSADFDPSVQDGSIQMAEREGIPLIPVLVDDFDHHDGPLARLQCIKINDCSESQAAAELLAAVEQQGILPRMTDPPVFPNKNIGARVSARNNADDEVSYEQSVAPAGMGGFKAGHPEFSTPQRGSSEPPIDSATHANRLLANLLVDRSEMDSAVTLLQSGDSSVTRAPSTSRLHKESSLRHSPAPLTDATVAAAVRGDREAVADVLRGIAPIVTRYCRSRLGRMPGMHVSPDDVAQEVCLRVLTALPSYRDEGRPFLVFVYGIAAHEVANVRREASRISGASVEDKSESPPSSSSPDVKLDPALAERMTALLDTLPARHREILVMRIVMDLSAEETAEAVGSTPGAVRVAQHRALVRLRAILEKNSG